MRNHLCLLSPWAAVKPGKFSITFSGELVCNASVKSQCKESEGIFSSPQGRTPPISQPRKDSPNRFDCSVFNYLCGFGSRCADSQCSAPLGNITISSCSFAGAFVTESIHGTTPSILVRAQVVNKTLYLQRGSAEAPVMYRKGL